jgi:hypothetical protein
VKVAAWCAVSARWIVGLGFLTTKKFVKGMYVILGQFFPDLTEERLFGWFQQNSATAHTARMSMQALMTSGTEIAAVVFGQHIHPILILVIFFSGVV